LIACCTALLGQAMGVDSLSSIEVPIIDYLTVYPLSWSLIHIKEYECQLLQSEFRLPRGLN
jgi:hypothetical protein